MAFFLRNPFGFGRNDRVKPMRSHANPLTYWGCQLFGWGGVALFGRIMDALQSLASPHAVLGQDHQFLPLTCLAGLVATHLLRMIITRGKWLEMAPGRLITRYATAIAITTLVLSLIGVTLFKLPSVSEGKMETFTIALMINSSLVGAWMAIYFLFHFYEGFHKARQEQLLLHEAITLSQLESLRLQLNPHFLFNALNSIRALIPASSAEAREAVTRLAEVLRATLTSIHEKSVPLAREMELVRDYLAVEKLRFGDHLRVIEEIAPEAASITIPPLMLLTVVENAIKHGVQRHEEAATLIIKVSIRESQVCLSVESPGSLSEAEYSSSLGIGLNNVRERLQLIYGQNAVADLKSLDDMTVRCSLRYPANTPSSV